MSYYLIPINCTFEQASIDILFSRHMNLNFLFSLDFMGKRRKSEKLVLIRKNSSLKQSFWCDILVV